MIHNSVRGCIPIELDRARVLRFGFEALAALHDKLGDNYLEALYTAEKNPDGTAKYTVKSWRALGTFIWAGLIEDCEDSRERLTESEVCKLIDLKKTSIGDLFLAVVKALAAAFGDDAGNAPAAGANANASSTSRKPTRSRSAH